MTCCHRRRTPSPPPPLSPTLHSLISLRLPSSLLPHLSLLFPIFSFFLSFPVSLFLSMFSFFLFSLPHSPPCQRDVPPFLTHLILCFSFFLCFSPSLLLSSFLSLQPLPTWINFARTHFIISMFSLFLSLILSFSLYFFFSLLLVNGPPKRPSITTNLVGHQSSGPHNLSTSNSVSPSLLPCWKWTAKAAPPPNLVPIISAWTPGASHLQFQVTTSSTNLLVWFVGL